MAINPIVAVYMPIIMRIPIKISQFLGGANDTNLWYFWWISLWECIVWACNIMTPVHSVKITKLSPWKSYHNFCGKAPDTLVKNCPISPTSRRLWKYFFPRWDMSPICSMYEIVTYMHHKFKPNVWHKYAIHGASGWVNWRVVFRSKAISRCFPNLIP